ncbi:MAG: SIMPL domain-containing protein [bacterium]
MLKRALEIFVASLIVAGVAGVYFRFVGGVPFQISQTMTTKMSTFDVSGEGKISVAPDRANIVLGVRETSPKVASAQQAANKTMTQVVAELKKMGIDEKEIKTTSYDIYPDYGPEGKPSGYVVSSQVAVKIADFELIPQALDLAGQLGLEQVGQLSFTLSDDLLNKTQQEARKEAVAIAKDKAEKLAGLAGVKLSRIVNISENMGSNYPTPLMYKTNVMAAGAPDSASAQVNPGTSEVSVSVTLSYETQ